ncbi:MAG: iron chelate uptake ABC transporter family permease subunit [Defluviitaleaceae bacterium]|nr:iron chelate uptake ABC transporter family permease subunit [Defluviitaleaceae bacterium]
MRKKIYFKMGFMLSLVLITILLYMFHEIGPRPDFVLPRRGMRILSMSLVGTAIAYSSIVFQTITNNRILTPSIIGFESVYMFIQTAIVFLLSTGTYFITGTENFLLSVAFMMLFSLVLYKILFGSERQNIHLILLVGMVLGAMFSSFTSFVQMIIDPNEFFILQNAMFASFNSINQEIIMVASMMIIATLIYSLRLNKYLDVMALGKENSIGLGVNHATFSRQYLLMIAILVSVSTALVGPITFLGVIVTNLTYQYLKTHKHYYTITTCIFMTIFTIIAGQFLVSRVFNFGINLSIIINFIGGLYFMYLLLKDKGR